MKLSLVPRLLALLVVVLLGGYYILVSVLKVQIGNAPFDVQLQLPRAGGLYTSADVTYRGVGVGTVTAIQVRPDGVAVTLQLDHGTRIPAGVDADVRQLSAIGEQYVDLVPRSDGGQVLQAGSVIPLARATVPEPIGAALNSLGDLLDSLDAKDLATVQDFLSSGFTDTAPDLRNLITTGQELTRALAAAQPQTQAAILNGTPVLTGLRDTNAQLAEYTRSLNALTGQFATSDEDLRKLLANGGPAFGQLTSLLSRTRDSLAGTITGLSAGAQAVVDHPAGNQELFQMLPTVALDLRDISASGSIRTTLLINGDSPVCSYLVPAAQPTPDEKLSTVDLHNGCSVSAPGLLQRGATTAGTR